MLFDLVKCRFLLYSSMMIGSLVIAESVIYDKKDISNFSFSRFPMTDQATSFVEKKVLSNGMTILVRSSHVIPKVSLQIWYNVGSKDELLGEKGIAHLIEHMIFKGTDILSESDINTVVHKLSGSCNAFTSFDYTGYLFNLPTHHWKEALPIMADCMLNCTFKDDMLNSEMKAVIQELKMYRDRYQRAIMEGLITAVFPEHPYHYPIIGFKHDLWTVTGQDLKNFYKKHYNPTNATLVVVGDVEPEDVFAHAEQHFGSIGANDEYKKKEYFSYPDIASRSLTLYRDVKQPLLTYAFVVPGAREKKSNILEILEWIIGNGKSSRLYRHLVNDEHVATSVAVSLWEFFDHGMFYIMVEPKDVESIARIEELIVRELEDLTRNGIQVDEFERAFKKTQVELYSLLEHFEDQAYAIGSAYLATGDENYVFTALDQPQEVLKQQAFDILRNCFRSSIMHKGFILPLPEEEKAQWAKLQQESDEMDEQILAARTRDTEIEPPLYAENVATINPSSFAFPHYTEHVLSNGIKLLSYNNSTVPMVSVLLRFKARGCYDPIDNQGLYNFVMHMITEGTKNYTAQELADIIESHGMSVHPYAGGIAVSMLQEDFEFGLEIIKELVTNAIFPEGEIEKVRKQILAEIKQYWDEPRSFIGQIVRDKLYEKHPYSKQALGTKESVSNITRQDLVDFYTQYITPVESILAIVGDLKKYAVVETVEKILGSWTGKKISELEFPSLCQTVPQEINYPINRDQIVLVLAQLSIERKHHDFDKFLLFDQIFGGGVLGSMSSRLFDLREKTGLFYTIHGSTIAAADEQPGMFQIRTIVSLDRLKEAEAAIKNTINTVIDSVTEQELKEAKCAIINTLVDNFSSNSDIAATFVGLDRFNFPIDYYDTRAAQLECVTLDDLKTTLKKYLDADNMIVVRAGRV